MNRCAFPAPPLPPPAGRIAIGNELLDSRSPCRDSEDTLIFAALLQPAVANSKLPNITPPHLRNIAAPPRTASIRISIDYAFKPPGCTEIRADLNIHLAGGRSYIQINRQLPEGNRSGETTIAFRRSCGKSFGLSVTMKSALPCSAQRQNGSSPGSGEISAK